MKPPATIHSGERIAHEKTFMGRFRKMLAVCDAVLNCRNFKVSDNNLSVLGVSSNASSDVSAFAITELGHQDYFVARQLTNVRLSDVTGGEIASVGATDFKIAKVVNVRRKIFTQQLFGATINYTDDDPTDIDNTRNADDGVNPTERQVCLPPYITLAALGITDTIPMTAQCVVYAKKMPGLTGVFDGETQLEWIEDAGHTGVRTFAKRFSA